MNEYILQIQNIAKNRGWNNFDIDFETFYIYNQNELIYLKPNYVYLFYEAGHIFKTSKVQILSSTNFIEFSEQFRPKTLGFFADYLMIQHWGNFIPFYITFLKAMPYD